MTDQSILLPADAPDLSEDARSGMSDILHLAAQIGSAPAAMINLAEKQPQAATTLIGPAELSMSFEGSICAHVRDGSDHAVIADLTRDPRTMAHPAVAGTAGMRFYAGVRLLASDGKFLGTLAVLDNEPRPEGMSPAQLELLKRLARQVVTQLELQRSVALREEAVLALREAETRHKQILDSAVDYAIITLDMSGVVTSWNTGAEKILGWLAEEICGQPAHVFFTPEDVAAGIPEVEMSDARRLGRGQDERWHLHKDGTRFFASGEMMPLTSADERQIGYLKILRDRTWNRQIQDQLRSSDERLQIALQASGVVGLWDWMVDSDLLHGDVNFARLYGLDVDKTASGLTMEEYQEFVPAEDLPDLRARIRATFDDGADFRVEYRIAIPGQPLRWIECKGRMIYDETGAPERFSGSAVDVTERVEAEAKTRLLAAIVEQSRDFIGVAAADGQMVMLNQHGRKLVGLRDEDQVASTTIQDYFDPPQWPIIEATTFPAVRATGHWRGELRFRHFETKELIPVIYDVISLRDAAGELTAYATVTRDIRDQKDAETRQHLLNEELSHRMKNTLTMVQAIAGQTLRGATEKEALATFNRRLHAIAAAHSVLLQQSWSAADIGRVAAGAMDTFGVGDRIMLSGPALNLDPRAALSLSLLLHELGTNATKYGALSSAMGTIDVAWRIDPTDSGDGDEVVLTWSEAGGPEARPPTRSGFGSRLVEMGLAGTGGSVLSYEAEGFSAEFRAPLIQIQAR